MILIHDAKSSNRCFQALDNFTVIPEALIITWLLDCGTCYAAHASHESFHSFYNLYSSYRGPTSLIRKTLLCRLEALRPAQISWDAEAITISYLFAQDICPPYLLLQVAQKAEEGS